MRAIPTETAMFSGAALDIANAAHPANAFTQMKNGRKAVNIK